MSATQRYWDGTAWTDHIAPADTQPQQSYGPQQTVDNSGLIAGAWITAILLPIVGFVLGIVLCAKDDAEHGIGAIVVSVIAFFVWFSILQSSGSEPVYYG